MCRDKLALTALLFVVLALLVWPQRLLASGIEPAGSALSHKSASEGALLAAATENGTALNRVVASSNVFFIMMGAVMILAMHGGFAFLEVGSVRKKNQVNALNKIICEWSFSTLIYFLIGYSIARGVIFLPWGGIAAGIFGLEALGGRGGVSFFSQLLVTAIIIIFALLASTLVYGILKMTVGIRLDPHAEQIGTDLAVHMIEAQPEEAF